MSGLFKRIFGRKKKDQTPEYTPPPAPKDQSRTMTVLTRLRDVSLIADQEQLTLKGTYAERRKEVLAASKIDDYDVAEKGLDSLEQDIKKQAADKDVYDAAYAGIPEKIASMPPLAETPPSLKDARKAVDDAEKLRAQHVVPAAQDYTTAKAAATLLKQKVEAFVPEYAKVSQDEKDYWVAYAGVPEKIAGLPALSATPPPLKEARKAVDDADTVRAGAVKPGSTNFATAKAAIKPITDKIDAFVLAQTKFNNDKKEYETNYAGLKDKVDNLPAENTLSATLKKRRQVVIAEDTKRADLVGPAKQDYAQAKAVALELKKKIAEYDNAAAIETKLKNPPVAKDQLEALVAKPGGAAALDELISNLDEASAKEVVRTALQVRFGLKEIIMEAEKDTKQVANNSWKRVYALMAKVPEAQVELLKTMNITINRSETQGTSSYSKTTKQINLRMDRDKGVDNDAYLKSRLTNDSGLPARDAGCEPENTDNVSSFDWTTLHEVGHAVDDGKNYMGQHGEALAGWKELTIDEVASAAAGHLSFPAAYIKAYLAGGKDSTPDVPDKPDNKTAQQWEDLRKAACEWCDAIRHTKKLWYNQGESAARKIGDFVYQQAYPTPAPGRFNRYKFSARSKGMRGYSFRAAGEWFADMYAAYHINPRVMKASHPCFDMIKDL
ncbi:MAG: hypothetical protein L0Y71_13330 [Gemmataceae bacterium]|nr:hypothetical protein [Gemmataceae bacterium]